MFEKSASARHKNQTRVAITLAGQSTFGAVVYTKNDERLIDLLNDDRLFIPVKSDDGHTMILAKSQVVSIVEEAEETTESNDSGVGGDFKSPKKPFDPYKILRVSKNASLKDIRTAYKNRLKAVHPDTMASLGLDEDLTRAAHLSTQKVNRAYQKIIRDRDGEAAKGQPQSKSKHNAA